MGGEGSRAVPGRIRALDGLRGIAAVSVVTFHVLLMFPGFDVVLEHFPGIPNPVVALLDASPARLLWAGHQAVFLFFLLSGFVLTLQLERARPGSTYTSYIVRRIARLYGPYLAVMVVAIALAWVAHGPVPELSGWFNALWSRELRAGDLKAVIFLTSDQFEAINVPAWSLVHEMRVSVILPLLVIAARAPFRWAVLGFLIMGLATHGSRWLPEFVVAGRWDVTVMVAGLFLVGCSLATHRDAVANLWNRRLHQVRWLLLAGALTLYSAAQATQTTGVFAVAPPAVLLMILALHDPTVRRCLESTIPQWLGRVSYCLYLSHMVVVLGLVHFFGAIVPPWMLILGGAIASFGVAEVLHRYLEVPCQRFGQRVANRTLTPALVESRQLA
jgi:peptidoglycan/LPS O-acetylase OafA/YrhL